MAVSRRDHLVQTALALFCRDGFRATGIDRVLKESGVAKKTLYNHFGSKEALIIAALEKRDQEFLAKIRATIRRLAPQQSGDPRLYPVLAFFDGLDEWFNGGNFTGCTFINASAEYPKVESPVHRACQAHKTLIIETLESLLADLPVDQRRTLACQMALLADGATVSAHTTGDLSAARLAKQAARRLLESFLREST
ncbi:MAG: TetR/AcrR family transcriptional regulator [Pseudomonadota bacterium]